MLNFEQTFIVINSKWNTINFYLYVCFERVYYAVNFNPLNISLHGITKHISLPKAYYHRRWIRAE